jgi:RNA-directed DNA polymerase
VVDADLAKFFDTIPHDALLKSVARRIVDRHVLHLIKMWLKVPVEERDPSGTVIMTGGKSNQRGTPQGGVVSPRLSNLYMNRFLKHWRLTGRPAAFSAHVVAYADDFVILSRRHGHEALEWTREVMTKLGLTVHETKTSVKDARHQQFDFLGYAFGPQKLRRDGHVYLAASPSRKSVQRLKDKIGMMLTAGDKRPCEEVVTDLNRVLRGWANYFSHGTRMPAFRAIDHHVYDRMRNFLAKRHKVETRGPDASRRTSSSANLASCG